MSKRSASAQLRLVGEQVSLAEDAPATSCEADRIARAQAGDRRAWEQLYLAHYRELLRFCSYAAGSVTVAEDLVQETFARALAGLGQFNGRARFDAWLRGISMNLLRKQWRKAQRRGRAYDRVRSAPRRQHQPDEILLRDARADALHRALQELPQALREAFVLVDVQGLGAAEAAVLAGTTAGNIRVRATRARTRIHEALVKAGHIAEVSS